MCILIDKDNVIKQLEKKTHEGIVKKISLNSDVVRSTHRNHFTHSCGRSSISVSYHDFCISVKVERIVEILRFVQRFAQPELWQIFFDKNLLN